MPIISQTARYSCLILRSFSVYWLLFSLRIWSNVIAAVIRYQHVLKSVTVHQESKRKLIAIYVLLGFVASSSSYLVHFYRVEYDPFKGVCERINFAARDFSQNRLILVRCIVILLVPSAFLFPIGTVIWLYRNILRILCEFNAPALVVAEIEDLLLREGYFLLLLTAPAHVLWLIEFMHCKEEVLLGNSFANGLALISGSYCVLNPLFHLINSKRK